MTDHTEVRHAAWKTRRERYGDRGHSGTYSRGPSSCSRCEGMLALIIKLHVEGTLSEGQVAKATGLHRIAIREMADDVTNSGPSPQGGVVSCPPFPDRPTLPE